MPLLELLSFLMNGATLVIIIYWGARHMTKVNIFMDGNIDGLENIRNNVKDLTTEVTNIKNILISGFRK